MDLQYDNVIDEDQSPLHIKRELDINIPFPEQHQINLIGNTTQTPRTAIRNTQDDDWVESTPKTQIDVSSPRLPFLTHSQIVGIATDDEELGYSKSNLHKQLYDVEEISDEQTPVTEKSKKFIKDEFDLDGLSMANSQLLKFSKKASASSERDSVISKLEIENSRLKEEMRDQFHYQVARNKELETEIQALKKKLNLERVRTIEVQMESEYKIATLNEMHTEREEQLKRSLLSLRNEIGSYKQAMNPMKSTQQTPQIQDLHYKLAGLVKLLDSHQDCNKDSNELLQWIYHRVRSLIAADEEEKVDEHREIINSLKQELIEVKQLRGQLSKIYVEHDQYMGKRSIDGIESKTNELNLQILALKQEKLELVEQNQRCNNKLMSQDQVIQEYQMKLNNQTQTDTQRKSSFFKTMQPNGIYDLKSIKETLKLRQDSIKKAMKQPNSPHSRSHNPSPTLKFLHSPKNQKNTQSPSIFANASGLQEQTTSDFVPEHMQSQSNTHHISSSCSINNNDSMFTRFVEQFRGNSSFAQKMQNYNRKQ